MTETRLTEHVVRSNGEVLWKTDKGLFGYDRQIKDELAQALLTERQRVEKLRASLEQIRAYRTRGASRDVWEIADQALREDGEGTQDG